MFLSLEDGLPWFCFFCAPAQIDATFVVQPAEEDALAVAQQDAAVKYGGMPSCRVTKVTSHHLFGLVWKVLRSWC